MVFNLSDEPSVIHEYLSEMRDVNAQRDRQRFRLNVERIGSVMAYEISRKLKFRQDSVVTPLGTAAFQRLVQPPVLVTILRAGIPFLNGFLNTLDKADAGFLGAYRCEDEQELKINLEYAAIPPFGGRTLIVVDPMLATGKSMVNSVSMLLRKETPVFIHIAAIIASPEGVLSVKKHLEGTGIPFAVWIAALDDGLNSQSYIVPGLGDAGDLSFGVK